ncbi:MAG: NAD-dependent epimerase/dehydratase family protein [Oscillospiraceae bacterium]|nr:NAD-dependent epimerase/dehydratase family protein [Oscillospiraceae bacterium]
MNILVTGGTVFVSRYTAEWFAKKGHEVYVLNRGSRPQPKGVTLIKADRHDLGSCLKDIHFDAVLDITAYTADDVRDLLDGLGSFGDYILISSSAVYPETLLRPFKEEDPVGRNSLWGDYGWNKIKAEELLFERCPNAYALRPPYFYGPMENLYREPFVFACADLDRPFYLPEDGKLPLQFYHVEDLCRLMETIIEKHPDEHVLNVGNPTDVTAEEFVRICYAAAGKVPDIRYVTGHEEYRYFPFRNYFYHLDTTKQEAILPGVRDLAKGMKEAYEWYKSHPDAELRTKPYMEYIDEHIAK